jgi:hypothetical protein
MATLADGVFVGRQREMGELKAALEDALSGQGRLVMLAGEPGIGKTRTAQEVMKSAALAGAQALWATATRGKEHLLTGPGSKLSAPMFRDKTPTSYSPRWALVRRTSL